MRDIELLPPSVLAVCLDLHALPDSPHLFWVEPGRNELPLSMANRLNWELDSWKNGPRSQTRDRGRASRDWLKLVGSGMDITAVDSAAEALEMLRLLEFDLGLIGADALGAAAPLLVRQVRVIAPQTKCIVVTASMSTRREQAIREAGVLAVVDGPMPLQQLQQFAGMMARRAGPWGAT